MFHCFENSKKALFLTLSFSLILQMISGVFVFVFDIPETHAANYTFNQTDWSGGTTAGTRTHTQEQSSPGTFTQFESSTPTNIDTSTAGQITLTLTADSATETSDTDFSAGTTATTAVTGSGSSASVTLGPDGGDGSDGACTGSPWTGGTLPGGTYNCLGDVTIASSSTVTVSGSALKLYATGNVTITGTLRANGGNASGATGGSAGAGGYAGGSGGGSTGGNGGGSGGGRGSNQYQNAGGGGYGGHGGRGSPDYEGDAYPTGASGGSALPGTIGDINGGSGGGAGGKLSGVGTGGGGGGGAIKISSAGTITIDGSITANGGNSTTNAYSCGDYDGAGIGGGGSGGGILLIAAGVVNNGTIYAKGGNSGVALSCSGGVGAGGRIEIYASSITAGTISNANGTTGYTVGSTAPTTPVQSSSITYASPGTFTSQDIDLGQESDLTTISWGETLPAGTDLQFQIRSAANTTDLASATWYGPTGTGDYYTTSSGENINSVHDGDRYIQYKAFLSTTDTSETPVLNDVTINYQYYPTGTSTLTSVPFDTENSANTIDSIDWTENLAASTDVIFQIRTAPDSGGSPGTWTNWYGPTSTSDYYTDDTGGETIYSGHRDGVDDQWVQYRVYVESSDPANTPTLSDINVHYSYGAAAAGPIKGAIMIVD